MPYRIPENVDFDSMVETYMALGLPMPPANSPMVHYYECDNSFTGFLVNPNAAPGKASVLVGTAKRLIQISEKRLALADVETVGTDSFQISSFETFSMNHGLASAVQCHAFGYRALARALFELSADSHSLMRCNIGDFSKPWETPEYSPEELLAGLAWNYWMNEMLQETDWSFIVQRFEALLCDFPRLKYPWKEHLLESMKAALVPDKTKSKIKMDISSLIWSRHHHRLLFNETWPESNSIYDRIVGHGFSAIPILIEHLGDRRLTHSVCVGFSNFNTVPLEIKYLVSRILLELSGGDLETSFIERHLVKKERAKEWFRKVKKEGESAFISRSIVTKKHGNFRINRAVLALTNAQYPEMLSTLFEKLRLDHPDLDLEPILDPLLERKTEAEAKSFLQKFRKESPQHSILALERLLRIDEAIGKSEFSAYLSELPEEQLERFGWGITVLVMKNKRPLWDVFRDALRKANVRFRTYCLKLVINRYDDFSNFKNRLWLLSQFLEDEESVPEKQAKPGGVELPSFPHTFEAPTVGRVKHYIVVEVGKLLGVAEKPASTWTIEEWNWYCRRILKISEERQALLQTRDNASFIEKLISRFILRPPPEDLSRECLEAMAVIEKTTIGLEDFLTIEIIQEDITKDDIQKLSKALKEFVNLYPEHISNGSAIWALSKLGDPTLAPFFLHQMRIHFEARRFHPVTQAAYGLLKLGHPAPIYDWPAGETCKEGYWKAVELFLASWSSLPNE